jgi:hypothetical protein
LPERDPPLPLLSAFDKKSEDGYLGSVTVGRDVLRASPKNILFINPWIYDFTAYDFWMKPLGLLYVASIVRDRANVRLHFIDCLDRFHPRLDRPAKSKPDGRGPLAKTRVSKPEVLKDIPRIYSRYGLPIEFFELELARVPVPDAVLITSVMTYWYPGVQLAVELVRKKFGSVPVILGGIYATLAESHARGHSGADFVIAGPAENKILAVLKEILGDSYVREFSYPFLQDLPEPAYDLLRDKRWLPVLSSRGCPHRCGFCGGPLLFPELDQRNPADAAAGMIAVYRRFGTRNFAFYDDALLVRKYAHILPLLEAVANEGLPLSFQTPNGLHVREIDRSLASLLKRAGFSSLYLSQETFDESLIRRYCPKVGGGDLHGALGALENAGFNRGNINVYLIAGLPGQDLKGLKEGILAVRRMGAVPRVAFFSPIPGTPIWKDLVRRGKINNDADPLLHNKLAFPYTWGDISPDDFESLRG